MPTVDDLQTPWNRICWGEICRLCETPLATPARRTARYCHTCAPTPALRPHPVYIHIDHWEGMTVQMAAEGTDLIYWMVRVSDATIRRLVDRLRIAPSEREKQPHALATWGRTCFDAHLDDRQARIFTWAARRDRRNGYEKLRGLPAGASNRRW